MRSRLEGSQRDRTVLSGLACDAVLIPVARWPVVRVALRDVMAASFARAEFCTTVVIGQRRQPSCRIRREEAKSPCLTPARLSYCGGHARQPAQIGCVLGA